MFQDFGPDFFLLIISFLLAGRFFLISRMFGGVLSGRGSLTIDLRGVLSGNISLADGLPIFLGSIFLVGLEVAITFSCPSSS